MSPEHAPLQDVNKEPDCAAATNVTESPYHKSSEQSGGQEICPDDDKTLPAPEPASNTETVDRPTRTDTSALWDSKPIKPEKIRALSKAIPGLKDTVVEKDPVVSVVALPAGLPSTRICTVCAASGNPLSVVVPETVTGEYASTGDGTETVIVTGPEAGASAREKPPPRRMRQRHNARSRVPKLHSPSEVVGSALIRVEMLEP